MLTRYCENGLHLFQTLRHHIYTCQKGNAKLIKIQRLENN